MGGGLRFWGYVALSILVVELCVLAATAVFIIVQNNYGDWWAIVAAVPFSLLGFCGLIACMRAEEGK